jgi:hypothetical protein
VDERREKDVAVLMLRGALGAVAGSAVFSLPFFNPYYLLVAIYSLPFTAFIGASVGVAIWWVHGRNKEEMGPVARAAIGAFVFILAEGCIALLSLLVERPFSSTSGSVVKFVVFGIGIGIVVGGMAGIITGTQTISERESA